MAIGFWLNSLHKGVDRFVDAVLFRRRHLAEHRLMRVASGLPHAQSYAAVATTLVREPVTAMTLLSGAFFGKRDDGAFHCDFAVAFPNVENIVLPPDDRLGIHLNGERGAVLLHEINWKMPTLADGAWTPVMAMPVFVRFELQAIIFYGAHATGEAFDPDEIRTLCTLCVSAGAALDHLEAVELRRQLAETERMLAMLTQNAHVERRLPAPAT